MSWRGLGLAAAPSAGGLEEAITTALVALIRLGVCSATILSASTT